MSHTLPGMTNLPTPPSGRLLILGGGTAGTMTANILRRELPPGWSVTVVDADDDHRYQPGFLFIPFGRYQPTEVTRSRRSLLASGVELVYGELELIRPTENAVNLADGRVLHYDALVIATGVTPRPDLTPGMTGPGWRESVHEFYTYEGAVALGERLREWPGGRLVVHIAEMPIKCPVAPLEFTFLADAFFRNRGIRDRVEITFVTPLDAAFTKPIAAAAFGSTLADRGIAVVPDFLVERVDGEAGVLAAFDGTEVAFDLLVTVPVNMGAEVIAASGMGNELNLVPVDKFTQQSVHYPNVFALGDCSDIPASKAGSVAHFQVDVFAANFGQYLRGEPMTHAFDGHANCFIETGSGKAMLIDFNYDVEPLPGLFPYPIVGPLRLLRESRLNHIGKLGFRWIYWNLLMPGRRLPIPTRMSTAGKRRDLLGASQTHRVSGLSAAPDRQTLTPIS